MAVILTPGSADRDAALAAFEAEGCAAPRSWGNGPGDTYARHDHREHKVLFCLAGSIVFHTDDGDLELTAGDRIDVPAFTAHAAKVGPDGCSCIEAYR
jgi:mannose-6-phosphate isomerase-like protein (cupin superfamily)